MKLDEIKTGEPFNNIFTIAMDVLEKIQQDMQENGYDRSQPIILWAETGIVVDGHTRLQAAKNLGIEEIPVIEKEFADEDAALTYAIHNQRDRRNLAQADLVRCIKAVDKRRERGGDRRSEKAKSKASSDANEKSSHITAKIVGTSPTIVEKVRAITADPEAEAEVMAGGKSVNQAYQETVAKRKLKISKPTNKKKPLPVYSGALMLAESAIGQLNRIHKADPDANAALEKVSEWIKTKRQTFVY